LKYSKSTIVVLELHLHGAGSRKCGYSADKLLNKYGKSWKRFLITIVFQTSKQFLEQSSSMTN